VLDPNSDEGYRGLAEAYSGMGKLQNAEATFRRAISLRPQYWAGYSWLGQFYFRQARYDEADQMFRKVLELSPDNFRAYSNLGGIHSVQGKYEEAIIESQKSIAIRPNLNAYLSLGTAYFGLRRYADAAATYEQGLKLDPKSYTNWGNLGDARYWTPGLRAKAPEAYSKAIELAGKKLQVTPRDETALSLQATYYAMLDNKPAALAALKKALAINPQNADLRFRAALVYNHFGDTDQTLKWIAKALEAGYPAKSIRDTPDFEGLKSDPRFDKALQR
jgi:tetratricopeptide (TPR) repeat protein